MKKHLLWCLLLVSSVASATTVDIPCMKTSELAAQVQKYDETLVAMGTSTNYEGYDMAVFHNKKEDQYTIIISNKQTKRSCVLDYGQTLKIRK